MSRRQGSIARGGDTIASRRFDGFFRASGIAIGPLTPREAEIARAAYRDFGKKRHKAGLNFGDGFAYALAQDLDEPLLRRGKDFRQTDPEMVKI
jgi:ribonuclease VapC